MLKLWQQQFSVCGKNNWYTNAWGATSRRKSPHPQTSLHSNWLSVEDVEDFLHKSGFVVNQCVPMKLQELEKNKQLKGVPGLAGENLVDKMYGRLVRTHIWGQKGTNLMQWWGVECRMHRWSYDRQCLGTPTQFITLAPTKTLCLLTYITVPYKSSGRKHNCLKTECPDLLNEIITNCLKEQTEQ